MAINVNSWLAAFYVVGALVAWGLYLHARRYH